MYCRTPCLHIFCLSSLLIFAGASSAQDATGWNGYAPPVQLEFKYASEFNHSFFFQDSKGFLWGVDADWQPIRFDGQKITSFRHNPSDSDSYSGNGIWTNFSEFMEDEEGKIWITSETGLDRYDPVTGRFEKFGKRIEREFGGEKIGLYRDIMSDSKGNVWIATGAVFGYFLKEDRLMMLETPGMVSMVFEDGEQNIWAVIEMGGTKRLLCNIDAEHGKLGGSIEFQIPVEAPYGWNIHDVAAPLGGQSFLLLTGFQLVLFDAQKREVSRLAKTPFAKNERVCSMYARDGLILLGTFKGQLFRFLPQSREFVLNPDPSMSGKKNVINFSNIFQSRDGIIWYLTENRMHKIFPKTILFENAPISYETPGYLKNAQYADVMFSLQGEAYLSTVPALQPVRKTGKPAPHINLTIGLTEPKEIVWQFDEDDNGTLWAVGSLRKPAGATLYIRQFDAAGKILQEFTCTSENKDCKFARGGDVWFLETDHDGGLWISTRYYLTRFDPQARQFLHGVSVFAENSPLRGGRIGCLFVDSKNNLWAGNEHSHASSFDLKTGEWTAHPISHLERDKYGNAASAIFEDSSGNMWISNAFGFFKRDRQTGQYRQYTEQQHLVPGPSVRKIFGDHRQNLWIATEKYLARYDPENDRFIPFTLEDGVQPTTYFNSTVYSDSDNYIYLPTPYDIVSYFHPDSLKINTTVPPVYFTDFQLANATVRPGDSTAILQKSLDFTEKITLRYAQNDFTIHYTAPEFIHPNETVFAIQLEGFNDDWQEVGTKREARYTNLSPGTYTFKVKVRNHHGFWSETPRTLQIVVLPPWYLTWWAYLLYALTIGSILFAIRNYELKRQLAKSEAQRLQELDLAKSRLYTNITHESRTPLTVILGMEEQVRKDPGNWFNEGLKLIRRNGKQLLGLVNQLLDLSKLESGHLPLKLVNSDVVSFLQYLTESFHSFADSKDIRVHFWSGCKELLMDYDPEKLQNVVSNLLSNAIKFTPAGGDVYVDLRFTNDDLRMEDAIVNRQSEIVILIRDNGIGIAPEHLPHIFDRFYQVDSTDTRRGEGTGIGLAMTKELVKLMGGEIKVESEPDKGTTFTVLLPVTQTAQKTPTDNPLPAAQATESLLLESEFREHLQDVPHSDQPLVLLIEDNADVITYLTSFLSSDYRIITATDGQQGIEKAIELTPDLVVSDVMMPEKDGFEVCATLKTDERTSHIPIILLTAKAGPADKLEGLTHGADAYLAKPFNREELLVRMEKLIELRRRLQAHYASNDIFLKNVIAENPTLEDLFLQKLVTIVEQNLSDEHFGLPGLCRKAALSRSQLFRKLKALTGKSTTHFIRSIRLAKGRELLETTDMTVSEVAYAVGFGSATYFAKMFGEEFGVPPSGVRK